MKDQLEEFAENETVAPGWKKFLLGWIDVFFVVGLAVTLHFFLTNYQLLTGISSDGIIMTFGALLLYRFVWIFLVGSTPGMFILKLKLLNGYEEKLNKKERLLASFFVMINGADHYSIKPS